MTGPGLSRAVVVEVRAALDAGASPAGALATVREGPLAEAGAAARLGRPLAEVAAEVETGEEAADLLVRALAVAELTGAGGAAAVEQALDAAAARDHLDRVLRARSAQARLSATVLTLVPAVLWAVLVGLDPAALRFYRTGFGALSAVLALALAAAGWWAARRLVARAAGAAGRADPLAPPVARPDLRRAAAAGVPVLLVGAWLAGTAAGAVLAAVTAGVAGRRHGPRSGRAGARAGGGAETVELVAAALRAGLDVVGALAAVAPLTPPAARPLLRQATTRLRAGWDAGEVFADTGLAELGTVLAATARWGAPADQALRMLAEDLRDRQRAAAEEAAERAQVALIFPTTLLTLPAFVLALVPPLVWTAFAGG